jgi:uncharacterized protein (DUF3084 family)
MKKLNINPVWLLTGEGSKSLTSTNPDIATLQVTISNRESVISQKDGMIRSMRLEVKDLTNANGVLQRSIEMHQKTLESMGYYDGPKHGEEV